MISPRIIQSAVTNTFSWPIFFTLRANSTHVKLLFSRKWERKIGGFNYFCASFEICCAKVMLYFLGFFSPSKKTPPPLVPGTAKNCRRRLRSRALDRRRGPGGAALGGCPLRGGSPLRHPGPLCESPSEIYGFLGVFRHSSAWICFLLALISTRWVVGGYFAPAKRCSRRRPFLFSTPVPDADAETPAPPPAPPVAPTGPSTPLHGGSTVIIVGVTGRSGGPTASCAAGIRARVLNSQHLMQNGTIPFHINFGIHSARKPLGR